MQPIDDTISAISTSAGAAARAIVRLSGSKAAELAACVFRPARGRLAEIGGFRWAEGIVEIAQPPMASPARAYVFRAPRSYTRQDVVEVHVPGCPALAEAVLAAIVAAGARMAEAGEFTARAFLSGRIDLSRAEAVADVISAADDAQARAAIAALDGAVHRMAGAASDVLAGALAAVEASIDLAGEELPLPSPAAVAEDLRREAEKLRETCRRAAEIPEANALPRAVLTGRPNVGKSSLLNRLTGTDRAIVYALAGTTRDVLSATLSVGGGAIVLQDAAGLGSEAAGPALAADAAARRAVAAADIVLFVVDLGEKDFAADARLLEEVRIANPLAPVLVVGNKNDLRGEDTVPPRGPWEKTFCYAVGQEPHRAFPAAGNRVASLISPLISVSCVTGQGMEELRAALADRLHLSVGRGGEMLGLHDRQKQCLLAAAGAAEEAAGMLGGAAELGDSAEIIAELLRAALAQIGQVSGRVLGDDVLGRIFARFCVGK